MATVSAATTVTFRQAQGDDALNATVSGQGQAAVVHYKTRWSKWRPASQEELLQFPDAGMRRDKEVEAWSHAFGMAELHVEWTGNGVPTVEVIGSLAEAVYTLPQRPDVIVVDGPAPVPAVTVAYVGKRTVEEHATITFQGERSKALRAVSPVITAASTFVDGAGETVPAPRWQQTSAEAGRFIANVSVSGVLLISSTKSVHLFQVSYAPMFTVSASKASGEVETVSRTDAPIPLVVRVAGKVALVQAPRSVTFQDVTPDPLPPVQFNLEETGRRIPVREKGVIWRQFPTKSEGEAPPPDPRTGRTDYWDQAQVIETVFRVEVIDGASGQFKHWRTEVERQALCQPSCSYQYGTFSRAVKEDTGQSNCTNGACP